MKYRWAHYIFTLTTAEPAYMYKWSWLCVEWDVKLYYFNSTLWSPLAAFALHLLLLSLNHLIFLFTNHKLLPFDMHHPFFGISFLLHSVSYIPITLLRTLLIWSTLVHLSHHHHCHCPLLVLFFTPGSKATFSRNPSHCRPSPVSTHHSAFMDSALLSGFSVFSFRFVVLLVWFLQ